MVKWTKMDKNGQKSGAKKWLKNGPKNGNLFIGEHYLKSETT